MLVLSRRVEQGVRIDGNVRVRVLGIRNGQVSLGFDAPRDIRIFREEVLRAIARENERAQLAGRDGLSAVGQQEAEMAAGAGRAAAAWSPEGGEKQDAVHVASRRFGDFEVPLARVLTLDDGLVGFPAARRHALLDHRPGSPFKWLLCVDEPELGFAVADPADFVPGYEAPVAYAAATLGCDPADVALFVLATIPSAPSEIFLNLLAPIVVDARSRRGCQLVLEDARLDPAHRVALLPALTAASR